MHIYDDRLVCYLGATPVLTVARRHFKRNGPRQRVVDYRHLIRKDQAETNVLYELIAERYERRSLITTCNQPFSAWNQIFPDLTMTVAAIDRLVHHASTRIRAPVGRSFSITPGRPSKPDEVPTPLNPRDDLHRSHRSFLLELQKEDPKKSRISDHAETRYTWHTGRLPTICPSVNRLRFIIRLGSDGLYSKQEI